MVEPVKERTKTISELVGLITDLNFLLKYFNFLSPDYPTKATIHILNYSRSLWMENMFSDKSKQYFEHKILHTNPSFTEPVKLT